MARDNAVALEIAIARALGSKGLEVVPPAAPLPPRPARGEGRGVVPAGQGVDLVLALRGRVDDPVNPVPYAYFTGDVRVYTAERYPEAPIWIGTVRTFTAYRDSYGPGSEMAPVPQPESVLQGVAAPLAASIVASLIQDRVLPL